MNIITFKQFLLEKITLYKPQPPGMMWASEHPWVDVYKLPVSQTAISNAMKEFGSVRFAVNNTGDVYMWNAGVLHKVFWMQNRNMTPEFNFMYNQNFEYLRGSTSNYSERRASRLDNMMEESPFLVKAFGLIKESFPDIKYIDFGSVGLVLLIDPPYKAVRLRDIQ